MRILFVVVVLVIMFSSCRKDQKVTDLCPQPLQTSQTSITVGDTNKMKVISLNVEVGQASSIHGIVTKGFAVWCNDSADIVITGKYFDGPGPSNFSTVNIESYTSVKFLHIQNGFATYVSDDTVYSGSNPTIMTVYDGYTCNPIGVNNVIHQIEDQIVYLDSGDIFTGNDYFVNAGDIVRGSWGYPPNTFPIENDTQLVIWEGFVSSCENLIFDSPKYVAFKINVHGIDKLGWMSIERKSGSSLFVHEIAVQH